MAPLILAIHWVIRVVIFALLIRAILSWVAPMSMHPAAILLNRMTEPVLLPIRNAIGIHNNVDFSPLVAIVILSLVDSLLFRIL